VSRLTVNIDIVDEFNFVKAAPPSAAEPLRDPTRFLTPYFKDVRAAHHTGWGI